MSDEDPSFQPVEADSQPHPQAPPPPEPQPEPAPPVAPEVEAKPEPEVEADADDDTDAKRIARLAHEAREAKRQARQLRAELDALKGNAPPPEPDAELDRRVQERADQLTRQREFDATCQTIYDAGSKEYSKAVWDSELKELADITGSHIPPVLVEAANDAGNAHQILHYLSEHTEEYEDLLNTPIHKMGARVAKIGNKLAVKAKPVSKAPPPISPVSGTASPDMNWDNMPIEQYMRERNAYEIKRRGY